MDLLSTVCGETASELMRIDDGLSVTLEVTQKDNAKCLDEFYNTFGEG